MALKATAYGELNASAQGRSEPTIRFDNRLRLNKSTLPGKRDSRPVHLS